MSERSAEELEREAERIRSGIAHTTDELKGRMSPGQMVDEVTRYLRDSDGSIALDRLRHQVRENPLALGLIGAGIAWLMLGGRDGGGDHREIGRGGFDNGYRPARLSGGVYGGTAGPGVQPGVSGGVYGTAGSGASPGHGASASEAGDVGAAVRERVGGIAERAGSFAHDASDRLREMRDDARDRASGFGHEAAERGRGIADTSRRYASRGRESVADVLDREPLVVGAIGLAVGAAIGAMLPNSRYEDEAFGDARDRLLEGAGEALEQVTERAGRAAEQGYVAARDAAEREGLLPSGERPVAEKLGNVARAAAGSAGAEGEQAAADARREVGGSAGSGAAAPSGSGQPGQASRTTGSGAGTASAGVGSPERPKTGTDDLASRGTPQRDVGPGGTGPA